MYVRSLSIQNLRSFESEELPLCYPGGGTAPVAGSVPHLDNITLLLGNNGAGKTTILRAVALSTLAPVLAMGSGYVPYALVRRVRGRPTGEAHVEAKVVLHEQDGLKEGEEAEVKATLVAPTRGYTDRFVIGTQPPRWQVRLYEEEESPAFLVLGYGATRRVETGPGSVESHAKERVLRYRRVAGLFEEHMTLMPLSAWLPRVKDRKRQQEAVELMNQLLPDTELLTKWGDLENPETLFRRGGSVLPYPALSDGYRAFICWVGDMLYHLNMICPKGQHLVDMRGVVLVDEVDLHLHPEWQRHLVPSLSRALPRIQFILTSHSPIVVGTLSSQNVLLLAERGKAEGVSATEVLKPGEELYGLSADQILTSDSFGLESTRDERFFERLKDVAEKAREGGAEEALRFMRMVAGGGAAERSPEYSVTKSEPLILRGHDGLVYTVAWHPKENQLVSASSDKTVRIWDVGNGEELAVLRGHGNAVFAAAWDLSGQRLASTSVDQTVRVWDARTGKELTVLRGHEEVVSAVSWDPAGRWLASSSWDQTVRVWEVETGKELAVLRGHTDRVIAIAVDPTGRRLASASWDKTVHLWDVEARKQLSVLRGHEDRVFAAAWDPAGHWLASASLDKTVRVWEVETGKALATLRGHDVPVTDVAWSPEGRLLASSSYDGTVRLWDWETRREVAVLRGHEGKVFSVAWDRSGHRLATAAEDKTVRVWEVRSTLNVGHTAAQPVSKSPRKRTSTRRKTPRQRGRK